MACGPGYVPMKFDPADAKAVAAAKQSAAKLVEQVVKDTRASIRVIVNQSVANGVGPKDTARLIRSVIGLNQKQANAVMNMQLELMADGVATDVAARRAERYAAQLVKARAETIARTETMRAVNEGQKRLWDQAIEQGYLDPDKFRKAWIISDDACERCQAYENETVDIDEEFDEGDPPLHPNCTCTIALVGKE